jgi:hypothetical protein
MYCDVRDTRTRTGDDYIHSQGARDRQQRRPCALETSVSPHSPRPNAQLNFTFTASDVVYVDTPVHLEHLHPRQLQEPSSLPSCTLSLSESNNSPHNPDSTMSYLLELPPGPLLPNALSPPYVVVGIWGTNITSLLPPKIPLKVLLHFIPKLQQWVLPAPAPSSLPSPLARRALRRPKIGIDILHNGVEPGGLAWITSKILQIARIDYPKSLVLINPTLETAISSTKPGSRSTSLSPASQTCNNIR